MRRAIALGFLVLAGCTPNVVGRKTQSSPSLPIAASGYEDLAASLFDDPGAGFVAVPEETKGLTLDQAVAGDDDPQIQRDRLLAHGYTRGFIRTWSSDDDSETVLYAIVYEFRDAAGARGDMSDGVDQARRDGDATFAVDQIAGATGIHHAPKPGDEANDSPFYAVTFVRGARLYLLTLGGPTVDSQDQAIALAQRMDAAASGSPLPSASAS